MTFQSRVEAWMLDCFGAQIAADQVERGDRLLEEVLELLQSGGYDVARVSALRDYVWGRPAGEPAQEVGGVMVTLAAYCLAAGLDMHDAAETELARILQPDVLVAIRGKQAAKKVGSALPVQPVKVDWMPEEIFDSYAVLQQLGTSQRQRTGPKQVADTLGALARLIRGNRNKVASKQPDQTGEKA